MSTDYSKKLLQIRTAEGLTQRQFAEIARIPLNTIQKYEPGHQPARAELVERVIQVARFQRYTLWLMTGDTSVAAAQISPPLSPDRSESRKADRLSTENTKKSNS